MNDFLAAIVTAVQTPPASPAIQPLLAPYFAAMPAIAGDGAFGRVGISDPLSDAAGVAETGVPGATDLIPPLLPPGDYDADQGAFWWHEPGPFAAPSDPGGPVEAEALAAALPSAERPMTPAETSAAPPEQTLPAAAPQPARSSPPARGGSVGGRPQLEEAILGADGHAGVAATADENVAQAAGLSASQRPQSGGLRYSRMLSADRHAAGGTSAQSPYGPADANALRRSRIGGPAAGDRQVTDPPGASLPEPMAAPDAAPQPMDFTPTRRRTIAGADTDRALAVTSRGPNSGKPAELTSPRVLPTVGTTPSDPERSGQATALSPRLRADTGETRSDHSDRQTNKAGRGATTQSSSRSDAGETHSGSRSTDDAGSPTPHAVEPKALLNPQLIAARGPAAGVLPGEIGAPPQVTPSTRSRLWSTPPRRSGLTPSPARSGEATRRPIAGRTTETETVASAPDANQTARRLASPVMVQPPLTTEERIGSSAARTPTATSQSGDEQPFAGTRDLSRPGSRREQPAEAAQPEQQPAILRADGLAGRGAAAPAGENRPGSADETVGRDGIPPYRPIARAVPAEQRVAPVRAAERDSIPTRPVAPVRRAERAAAAGTAQAASIIRPAPEALAAGRAAAAAQPRAEAPSPVEPLPTIRVTIGRIEVRARSTEAAPVPARPMPRPPMSLDAYLGRAARGNR